MRSHFSIIVFVFYMTSCFCGIIYNAHHLKVEQDNGKTRERRAEDGVNYGGGRWEVSENVPESHPLMHDPNAAAESLDSYHGIKEKRCPRDYHIVELMHDTNPDDIVGANEPVGVTRRDIHDNINKIICTNCITRCRRHNTNCKLCSIYCGTPDEMGTVTESTTPPSATEGVVGSAIEGNNQEETIDDVTLSVANRFDDEEPNKMKRVYTIATLKSGLLKEVICKLLGISDISDIDTVVVWITTKSNQPPQFSPGYNKQVSPNTEKLTKQLNDELAEALKKKVQQGGNFLTNADIEEAIGRIFDNPQYNVTHVANSQDTKRTSESSLEDDISLPHSIDLNSIDLNMPSILNPGLLEETPYMNLREEPPKNIVGVPTEARIGQTNVEDSSESGQGKTEFQEDSDDKEEDATSEQNEPETTKDLISAEISTGIDKPVQGPEDEDSEIEDEKETETDADKNDTLGTSKVKNQIKNKKIKGNKMQPGFQNYPKHRSNVETGEPFTGISQNPEDREGAISEREPHRNFDGNMGSPNMISGADQNNPHNHRSNTKTDDNITGMSEKVPDGEIVENDAKNDVDDNDTLGTSKLKNKFKNKANGIQPGYQHYPYHRSNAETGEAITGLPQESKDREGINSELDPERNLEENFGPSNTIPGAHQVPQDHGTGAEAGDTIIGGSKNLQNSKNNPLVYPSAPQRQKPPEFVHQLANKAPQPVSANQEKKIFRLDSTNQPEGISPNSEVPPNKNIDSETIPVVHRVGVTRNNRINPGSSDMIGSPNADGSLGEPHDPHVLKEKPNASNEENNVEEMREPIGSVSSKGVIVSPNIEGEEVEEDRDSGSKVLSSEEDGPFNKVEVDNLGSQRNFLEGPSQLLDNIKTQWPALKDDVQNIVKTIEKATNMDTENRLLGQEQPVDEMEQNISDHPGNLATDNDRLEIPDETASATIPSSLPTADITRTVEPQRVPQQARENTGERESMANKLEDGQQTKEMIPFKLDDDRVRSQLLEDVPWDTDRRDPMFTIPQQREQVRSNPMENKNSNAGTKSSQFLQENSIPEDQTTNQDNPLKDSVLGNPENTPDMENRNEFTGTTGPFQHSLWSNSLGKFVTADQLNQDNYNAKQPKDIYFIGNGIKLPLQMVRKNDGAVHLSVDLDKICSCKNSSCPKNQTAIEETVGTILEKEAELKDQLSVTNVDGDKQEESDHQSFEDPQLGMAASKGDESIEMVDSKNAIEEALSTNRYGRGTSDNKWPDMKYSRSGKLNSDADFHSEDVHVFKRSVSQDELNKRSNLKIAHDKRRPLIENSITNSNNEENNIMNRQIGTTTAKAEILAKIPSPNRNPIAANKAATEHLAAGNSLLIQSPVMAIDDATPNYLQQLINQKLSEVRSRMSTMERRNELKNKQMLVSQEKLKNIFNTIGGQTILDSFDTVAPKISTDEMEDKIWKSILNQSPANDKRSLDNDLNNNLISPSSLSYKSVMKDKGNEMFDEVTPIKSAHQFKALEEFENKLEELGGYVKQYSKDGDKMIRKEARNLLKMHSDNVIKQEVDILNNILTWIKNLAVD